jgi:hypothetical protein
LLLATPAGLALAGPLVSVTGAEGGMVVSALLTIALVPLAGAGLRRSRPPTRGTPVTIRR